MIPVLIFGEKLDKTDASFDQASSNQAPCSEFLGFGLIDTVEFLCA